ncbi:MAG TPA: hypothetical protein VF164_09655, partial [Trueperaceae bacterium]
RGLPLVRHPWLAYPEDLATLTAGGQFFLGRSVLVAPVMHQGRVTASAYLPAGSGEWFDPFGGSAHEAGDGRRVDLQAPLGRPGILLARGDASSAALAQAFRDALN